MIKLASDKGSLVFLFLIKGNLSIGDTLSLNIEKLKNEK